MSQPTPPPLSDPPPSPLLIHPWGGGGGAFFTLGHCSKIKGQPLLPSHSPFVEHSHVALAHLPTALLPHWRALESSPCNENTQMPAPFPPSLPSAQ